MISFTVTDKADIQLIADYLEVALEKKDIHGEVQVQIDTIKGE